MDDLSFQETIDRLRLGQELVGDELERVAQAGAGDHRAALWRLSKAARTYHEQASTLLLAMLEQGAPEDLLQVAEELAGFFNEAVEQTEAMLGPGRG